MNRKQFIVLCIAIMVLAEGYLAIKNVDYSTETLVIIATVIGVIAGAIIYSLRDRKEPTEANGNGQEKVPGE